MALSKGKLVATSVPKICTTMHLLLLMATRNPARKPVQVGSEHPMKYTGYRLFFIAFLHPRWLAGFLPSTVSLILEHSRNSKIWDVDQCDGSTNGKLVWDSRGTPSNKPFHKEIRGIQNPNYQPKTQIND